MLYTLDPCPDGDPWLRPIAKMLQPVMHLGTEYHAGYQNHDHTKRRGLSYQKAINT